MTVMRRWLDSGQAPPEVLELLKAARPPTALDPATRARSRRRVAALAALPVTVGLSFWFKSVALGAILGSAATVVVVLPNWSEALRNSPPAPSATVAPTVVRSAPPIPRPPPIAIEDKDAGFSAATRSPSATSSTVAVPKTGAATPTALNDDDLSREIQLLERARQLLAVDPSRAQSTLNEHQREFGNGILGLERQFLEVEALLRLGKRDAARQHAAALRARAPGSLYERRLKQLLGAETSDEPSIREDGR